MMLYFLSCPTDFPSDDNTALFGNAESVDQQQFKLKCTPVRHHSIVHLH